ncbi:MAG: DUF6034 family protein [Eubacteriales bacterium]|nr:DUF6034 family protein [Eubacteriales bacterium]
MTILNTLLEITIYSAALYGAIMLFRALLKKHASPVMLYMVWFILIARLLMPVTINSGFSLIVIPSAEDTVQAQEVDFSALPGDMGSETESPAMVQDSAGTQTVTNLTAQSQDAGTSAAEDTAQTIRWSFTWDWNTALISLWLGGASFVLLHTSASAARLKKRLKADAVPAPPEWRYIAEEIQAELGIRRDVRIVMMKDFVSPALSASLRPTVVMPKQMFSQSAEQIAFALRHELMHFKRRDHLVCLLLMLLKAVYWFNPVVWLAAKQMKMDMETACDGMVVRSMDNTEKKLYAATIIDMYAKEQTRFVLGMAMGHTKQTAERRIRGIFMRKRSSRRVRIMAALLAAVMLMACFTTACQPTPEEAVIVQRDALEDKIAQTAAPVATYSAPETWTETVDMQGSEVPVTIDAVITVPDVDAYPVYNVEAASFTQEQIDALMDYFVQGKSIFTIDYERTKEELQQELVEAKRGQFIDGEYVVTEDSLAWVEELERRIEAAPETVDRSEQYLTDLTIKEDGSGFGGYVELGGGKYGFVHATNNEFNFTNGWYSAPESQLIDQYGKGVEGEIALSQDDAFEAAQHVLDAFGISDMVPVSVEKALFYPKTSVDSDVTEESAESKGYYIKYARSIDGIATELVEGFGFGPNDTFEYSAPWLPEQILIYVDEDAQVQYFDWRGPLTITELVSENASLMDFDDMKEKIRNQIFYNCAYLDESYGGDATVNVESIELKMTLVGVKDEPDKAMYVPAWYIRYVKKFPVNYTDDNGNRITEQETEELLILNAVDGGRMAPFPISSIEDMENAIKGGSD